jgi:hypothetical protein
MDEEENEPEFEDTHLPALEHDRRAWAKTLGLFAILVAVNVVAFLVSYGVGVIITLPLTIFLAFLLLRDLAPRHRLPPGRPRSHLPA